MAAGAAVAILLIVIGSQLLRRSAKPQEPVWTAKTDRPLVVGILDYRNVNTQRGTEEQSLPERHQVLSASTNELQITLKNGSAAGDYEIDISSAALVSSPIARFTGKATVGKDGVTELRSKIDFSRLQKGTYVVKWHLQNSESYGLGKFFID